MIPACYRGGQRAKGFITSARRSLNRKVGLLGRGALEYEGPDTRFPAVSGSARRVQGQVPLSMGSASIRWIPTKDSGQRVAYSLTDDYGNLYRGEFVIAPGDEWGLAMRVTVSSDGQNASLMFIRVSDVLMSHQGSPVTSRN